MGKEMKKNKCVLVSAWQEFLFSLHATGQWKFVLRHEFVQCISGC